MKRFSKDVIAKKRLVWIDLRTNSFHWSKSNRSSSKYLIIKRKNNKKTGISHTTNTSKNIGPLRCWNQAWLERENN